MQSQPRPQPISAAQIPPQTPPQTPRGAGPHRFQAGRPFATPRAIMALMLREMATTYGRSPGGYIWAILEPALSIALLTVFFSLAFRSPPIGENFPMFYATGMLPFLMYSGTTGKIAASLKFSKSLLAYPSVTFVDAILARFLLNGLTDILVAYIILTGIYLVFDTRTIPELPGIALGFSMALALGLGLGTLNCFLSTMFPLWQTIWSIISRPMFLMSGVLFLFGNVPQPWRDILWYNPVVHVIGQLRGSFYPTYDASYVSPLYVFGVALVLGTTGLVLLSRHHRNLLTE